MCEQRELAELTRPEANQNVAGVNEIGKPVEEREAQATFEAWKFLDKEVQRQSGSRGTAYKPMRQVFSAESPPIELTLLSTTGELDEQKGYQFTFGTVPAIRNPRSHEFGSARYDNGRRCVGLPCRPPHSHLTKCAPPQ